MPWKECRRPEARRFKELWLRANGDRLAGKAETMSNLDALLHSERIAQDGTRRGWSARLSDLSDGVMVNLDDPGAAFLYWQKHLFRWSPGGYVERKSAPLKSPVEVLTPPSVTGVLAAGYRPIVHPSAAL